MSQAAPNIKNMSQIIAYLGQKLLIECLNDGCQDTMIAGIAYDSRKVKKDYVFYAMSGVKTDGHQYIPQAIANGAVAIVVERPIGEAFSIPAHVTVILCREIRLALGHTAAYFYDFPDRFLRLIGVTGTNGKTTTTNLIKWIFECFGQKTGLIGTIENKVGDLVLPASHTTPESLELFELLHEMKSSACRNVVMEVSSHGLKQGRVAQCHFDGAVFTNLTQDHLDYHLTFEDYLASKNILFSMVVPDEKINRYGIVNIDDPASRSFMDCSQVPVYTYGMNDMAMVRAVDYRIASYGTVFRLLVKMKPEDIGIEKEVKMPLIGKFNIYNCLAAICVGLAEGLDLDGIIVAMEKVPQVAGRFELVDEGQDFSVVVDYAHSPDGLLNVLSSAKELNPTRIITVFGCGGDRDKTKRPIMGKLAGSYSDIAIITSDNPRTEEPMDIICQVEQGTKSVTANYYVEENRRKAIALAIKLANPGDMIVIAGKGHENYQLVKGQVLHFDDRETARELISERLSQEVLK